MGDGIAPNPVLQHQQEILEDAQQRMAAWTKRRQEAIESGIDALKRMSGAATPIAAAGIYGEWMSSSINRLLADFQDAQAHALKMAEQFQHASKTMLGAAQLQQAATHPVVTEVTPSPAPSPQLREAAD